LTADGASPGFLGKGEDATAVFRIEPAKVRRTP
jgi:hypothetical protein